MSAVQDQILIRIREHGRGRIFISKDFLDIGSRDAADQALSRLAKSGELHRLARGLYLYPRKSHGFAASAPPDQDEIAEALGRQTGCQMVPSGAMAASRLGLAKQVPTNPAYLTDGRTRQVKIDNIVFEIRHAAPKDLPAASRTSSMVFQALRHIGKEAVDYQIIEKLRSVLTSTQRKELLRDAKYTTDWIAAAVRQITSDDAEVPSHA